MSSEKKQLANRVNAVSSTGPRSLAGKSRSRFNAVKHGLTAMQVTLPGEDPREFDALRNAMFTSLLPQGVFENQLVERAASLVWRMRRVQAFEVALLEWTAYYQSQSFDAPHMPPDGRNDFDNLKPLDDLDDSLKLGRVVETLLNADLTSKLSRYETSMQRQLSMTLKELRAMKTVEIDMRDGKYRKTTARKR